MKTLVIIPAYNEALNIENVIETLVKICPKYDYVIVNDGSTDNTLEICTKRNYNIINLPVNLGLAGAFQTGMKFAFENDFDCAVQFDADGQHLPEYIKCLENGIIEGFDIVVGSRFVDSKKKHSLRMLGSRLIALAIRITTGKKISDPTSGMRMYSKKIIKEFAYNINYGPEPDTLSFLMKNGATVVEVPVKMADREYGESYLNFIGSVKYMTKMLLSIVLIQNFRKRG